MEKWTNWYWWKRIYWYFHGPVGNPQPRGEHYMSAGGVVWFFVVEFVLFAVLMLVLYGIKTYVSDGEVKKWSSVLAIVIIGGIMLIKLLGFAGIA